MIIIPANTLSTGAYEVANSCRFNIADSTQLTKAVSSSATTKYTLSLWVKRGLISTSAANRFFVSTGGSGLGDTYFRFNPNDTLEFSGHGSSATTGGYVITNRVFRDPTSWMHIVIRYDSTQGTANDRFRLYINGVDERNVGGYSTSTMPNQNVTDNVTANGNTIRIGATASAQYFDGYMAEIHFSEGQSYAPTEFGEYNEDSPTIWQPKEADISYGTSGFYLDFEDSSNLGNDANGGTDFTEVNLAAIDQTTDTCTNNFSTLNPLATSSLNDLSQANVKITGNSASNDGETFSTFIMPNATAKWYWEIKCTNKQSTGNPKLGFSQASKGFRLLNGGGGYGGAADGDLDIMVRPDGKTLENGSTSGSAVISTWDTDDVLSFALDSVNGAFYVGINGTWQTSGDPTSGSSKTGAIKTWTTTDIKCVDGQAVCIGSYNGSIAEANFGNPSYSISSSNSDGNGYGNFEYSVPSGYLSLCTKNLGSDGG